MLPFFSDTENTYQKLLQYLHTFPEPSKKNLEVVLSICHDLLKNRSSQNLNENVAICFTHAEVYTRLALILIDEQDANNATACYSSAFEACDLAEEYMEQVKEQQQTIDENLLKMSNSYGLTTPSTCRDKIYEILSKPLDVLLEKNHCRHS